MSVQYAAICIPINTLECERKVIVRMSLEAYQVYESYPCSWVWLEEKQDVVYFDVATLTTLSLKDMTSLDAIYNVKLI